MTVGKKKAASSRAQAEDVHRQERRSEHGRAKVEEALDRELDEALMDTFPSSDPPAISQPKPRKPAGSAKAKP